MHIRFIFIITALLMIIAGIWLYAGELAKENALNSVAKYTLGDTVCVGGNPYHVIGRSLDDTRVTYFVTDRVISIVAPAHIVTSFETCVE